jgi:hypothetical protein
VKIIDHQQARSVGPTHRQPRFDCLEQSEAFGVRLVAQRSGEIRDPITESGNQSNQIARKLTESGSESIG